MLIKKSIIVFILILLSFCYSLNSVYSEDLNSLQKMQNELAVLKSSELSSLVFFSEYDFVYDTKLYYNPSTRDLIEKLSLAEKHCENANVAVAYYEYKKIIDTMSPNDFYYMLIAYNLTQRGFFSLAHNAMNKVEDKEIWASHIEAIRKYAFPYVNLKVTEEVFFAELLSDIVYNNMTNESLARLSKSESSLANSDYGCYLKSKAYFAEKKEKEALSEINKALAKNPQNMLYLRFKAEILNALGKAKDALFILNKLPDESLLYVENQKFKDKIKYYTLTGSKEGSKKFNLAYYFYLNKDYQRAINELNLLLIRGDNKQSGELLGHIYLINGNYIDAEKLYRKLLTKSPKLAYAHKGLGDIYLHNGKNALAYAEYKTALKYNPKDCENYVGVIVSSVKIGDVKGAKKYLEKAKSKFPNNFKILYLCSRLEYDKGKQFLKNSLKYNPFYPEGWLDLAGDALVLDDTASAEEYVNTAAFITKNSPRYFYFKSILNTKKKDEQTAYKDILRAKELYTMQVQDKQEL